MRERDLVEQIAATARALSTEADTGQTLETAVALATKLVVGCDEAGITLVHRGEAIETHAATSDGVERGDQLQYELQEGPCLDAAWDHEVVNSPDLAADDRWPTWGPRAVKELGVRSMLCFQLFTDQDTLGALNLYSKTEDAFTTEDEVEGMALAAQVAVALAATQQIDNLSTAVVSRTIIGQAQGLLMERFTIGAEQAFAVLQRVSNQNNRKLYDVCAELIETRRTPT